MGGLLRSIRSGPWYLRAVCGVAFSVLLLWPLLLDLGTRAPASFVLGAAAGFGANLAESGQLREGTGWDRARRVREVDRARAGVLPEDAADRRRVAWLVATRLRQRRGAEWVLLGLLLVCAVLTVVRQDRYPHGWAPVSAAWFTLVGGAGFLLTRRGRHRDAGLLRRLGAVDAG